MTEKTKPIQKKQPRKTTSRLIGIIVILLILLALNLPPDLPLWMAAVGGVFAIAVAKQAFGGLGYNPFNPALAARAFMLISFTIISACDFLPGISES